MSDLAVNPAIAATLRRSARRRSIGIKVHRGQVVVSAPVGAPLSDIKKFVQQKSQWIEKHLLRQRQALVQRREPLYAHGDSVQLLGQTLTLQVHTPKQLARLEGSTLILGVDGDELSQRKSALECWYVERALDHLPPRIEHFQQVLDVQPRGIKVRHYKSRWGSCNRRGELQFNWLLMMAPEVVIDYVVVHELAHLRHFNHSQAFWQLVASAMPDYARQRQWLKNQTTLFW